jgi:hypothetical protein
LVSAEPPRAPAWMSRKALDMPPPRRRPTLREVLDELEAVEIALSSVVRRWEDGPSAEIREEIMLEAYEPVLHLLIRTERRGQKQRWPRRKSEPP